MDYAEGDQRLDNGFIELSFVTTFDEGQIITFQVADHKIFYLETLLRLSATEVMYCIPVQPTETHTLKLISGLKILLLFF